MTKAWRGAGIVFAIVALPKTAAMLPHGSTLKLEALMIVSILAFCATARLLGPCGSWRRDGENGLGGWLLAGTLLYGAAAWWGAAAGLWWSNPTQYWLGQTLSMLLLPASVVIFSRFPCLDLEGLGLGFLISALFLLGCYFLLVFISVQGDGGGFTTALLRERFRVGREVALAGPALAGLLICLGWWFAAKSRTALLGIGLHLVLLLGGMSRAQWICAVFGGLLLVGIGRLRGAKKGWVLGGMTLVLTAAVLWLVLDAHYDASRRPITERTVPAGDALKERENLELFANLPVQAPGLELRFESLSVPGGRAVVWLVGRKDGRIALRAWGLFSGHGESSSQRVVFPLRSARGLVDTVDAGFLERRGNWQVGPVEVYEIKSGVSTLFGGLIGRPVAVSRDGRRDFQPGIGALLWQRGSQLVSAVITPEGDLTAKYRLDESKAVLRKLQEASWGRKIVGHGLGATFEFENPSWDAEGRRISLPEANYIHNFYLFLLFKLGAGGIFVVVALISFAMGWTTRLRRLDGGSAFWLQTAALAVFASHLLLSVSSPALLSFRLAPVLGLLIGACASGRKTM